MKTSVPVTAATMVTDQMLTPPALWNSLGEGGITILCMLLALVHVAFYCLGCLLSFMLFSFMLVARVA